MGRTSGGQVCVNADLKGCLSSLCHLSVIFERERELESFWYSYILEWTMVEKKSKSKSEDRELHVWRRKKRGKINK